MRNWPQGCLVEAATPAWPTPDEARDGWYGGLPCPLYDMRPQGFLGRAFARHHAGSLTLPSDPDGARVELSFHSPMHPAPA